MAQATNRRSRINLTKDLRTIAVAGLFCLISQSLFLGCKKKPAADAPAPAAEASSPAPAPAAPTPPPMMVAPSQSKGGEAAAAVRAALDRREYGTAVSGTLQFQKAARTPEEWSEAAVLKQDVMMRLLRESQSDPQAAGALAMMRTMSRGR